MYTARCNCSKYAIFKVKAPWVDKFYYYDSDTYIIPSKDNGTVVLGGCRHFGSHDEQANPRNTEEILERCTKLIPSLREALNTSYEVWVGLRPYRNKIRVEAERLDDTLVIRLCTNYIITTRTVHFGQCSFLGYYEYSTTTILFSDDVARNLQRKGM